MPIAGSYLKTEQAIEFGSSIEIADGNNNVIDMTHRRFPAYAVVSFLGELNLRMTSDTARSAALTAPAIYPGSIALVSLPPSPWQALTGAIALQGTTLVQSPAA